jgi:hypothetical protein
MADAAALDAAQAAVEQACAQFLSPATQRQAEATLLAFRASAAPIAACRHILQRSRLPDARFQAACTLREALVRDWAALQGGGELGGLRDFLLDGVLAAAAEPGAAAVRATLASALAIMLKRSWEEQSAESRAGFLQARAPGSSLPVPPPPPLPAAAVGRP